MFNADINNKIYFSDEIQEIESINSLLTTKIEDGLLIVNTRGAIVAVNQKLCDLLKYSPIEIIGEKIEKLVPQEFQKIHVNYRDEYIRSPKFRILNTNKKINSITKDGELIPVLVSLVPLNINNEPLVASFVRDNSDFADIADQIQLVTNFLNGAIFKLARNSEGKIAFRFVGDKIKHLIGLNAMEIKEDVNKFIKLLDSNAKQIFSSSLEKSAKSLSHWRWELPFLKNSTDSIWLGCYATPTAYSNGEIVWTGILLDITDKKLTEFQNQSEQNNRTHKDRLMQMGEIMAQVAHDFSSPLNAIGLVLSELKELTLLEQPEQNKNLKISGLIDKCDTIVGKLYHRVDKLRRYAKKDLSTNFSNIFIEDLTEDIELFTSYRIKQANCLFSINNLLVDKHGFIYGNLTELTQVFVNIINNSADALNSKSDGQITLNITEINDDYVFEISDNGVGIPDSIKDRIFEPYFTTKNSNLGTGLGLGIVKKTVLDHKGTISFDSNKSQTTFKISLPKRL